jgi:hypothetical protein
MRSKVKETAFLMATGGAGFLGGYPAGEAIATDVVKYNQQVLSCANYLGQKATLSFVLPEACLRYESTFTKDITTKKEFVPNKDSKTIFKETVFHLPSSQEFIRTRSFSKADRNREDVSLWIARFGLAAVALGIGTTILSSRNAIRSFKKERSKRVRYINS